MSSTTTPVRPIPTAKITAPQKPPITSEEAHQARLDSKLLGRSPYCVPKQDVLGRELTKTQAEQVLRERPVKHVVNALMDTANSRSILSVDEAKEYMGIGIAMDDSGWYHFSSPYNSYQGIVPETITDVRRDFQMMYAIGKPDGSKFPFVVTIIDNSPMEALLVYTICDGHPLDGLTQYLIMALKEKVCADFKKDVGAFLMRALREGLPKFNKAT